MDTKGLGQGNASRLSKTYQAKINNDVEIAIASPQGSLFSTRMKAIQKIKVVGSIPIRAVDERKPIIHNKKPVARRATTDVGIELSASISRCAARAVVETLSLESSSLFSTLDDGLKVWFTKLKAAKQRVRTAMKIGTRFAMSFQAAASEYITKSKAINTSAKPAETRASRTFGTVKKRIITCGNPAVPTISDAVIKKTSILGFVPVVYSAKPSSVDRPSSLSNR